MNALWNSIEACNQYEESATISAGIYETRRSPFSTELIDTAFFSNVGYRQNFAPGNLKLRLEIRFQSVLLGIQPVSPTTQATRFFGTLGDMDIDINIPTLPEAASQPAWDGVGLRYSAPSFGYPRVSHPTVGEAQSEKHESRSCGYSLMPAANRHIPHGGPPTSSVSMLSGCESRRSIYKWTISSPIYLHPLHHRLLSFQPHPASSELLRCSSTRSFI